MIFRFSFFYYYIIIIITFIFFFSSPPPTYYTSLFIFSFFFPHTPPHFLFSSYLLSSFSFNTQISPSTLASMATILSENFRTASLDGIVDGEVSSREASEQRGEQQRSFRTASSSKTVHLQKSCEGGCFGEAWNCGW